MDRKQQPAIFNNLSAWFSRSVPAKIRSQWVKHGGRIGDCRSAQFIFSQNADYWDTKCLYQSDDYITGCLAVYHSGFIDACLKKDSAHKTPVSKYLLLPSDFPIEINTNGTILPSMPDDSADILLPEGGTREKEKVTNSFPRPMPSRRGRSRMIEDTTGRKITDEPIERRMAGGPTGTRMADESIGKRVAARPAGNRIADEHPEKRIADESIMNGMLDEPTDKRKAGEPAKKRMVGIPAEKRMVGIPTGKRKADEHTEKRIADEPTGKRIADEPTGKRKAGEPTEKRMADIPTVTRMADEPTEKKKAGEPTDTRMAGRPTGKRKADEPTRKRTTDKPTGNRRVDEPNGNNAMNRSSSRKKPTRHQQSESSSDESEGTNLRPDFRFINGQIVDLTRVPHVRDLPKLSGAIRVAVVGENGFAVRRRKQQRLKDA